MLEFSSHYHEHGSEAVDILEDHLATLLVDTNL